MEVYPNWREVRDGIGLGMFAEHIITDQKIKEDNKDCTSRQLQQNGCLKMYHSQNGQHQIVPFCHLITYHLR